jgi:hypothetical protein
VHEFDRKPHFWEGEVIFDLLGATIVYGRTWDAKIVMATSAWTMQCEDHN